mmetsp:Transcript_33013/g.60515  ORF Transcript_33013/g.60515 Transcript_33013/m.60515 type:complete len:260 (+) Transcript_33013:97-876(+)
MSSSSSARALVVDGVSFITHPQLTQLNAVIKAVDAGDRIVKGRLELFSFSRKKPTRRQLEELERVEPTSFTDSPLGPLSSDLGQVLLSNLTSLMTLLFQDYDCSQITPGDFERCPDKALVANTINHNLASVVDRVHSGFLADLWQAVQDAIELRSCEILAFQPKRSFEPLDKSLMSFHYFFVDLVKGRILFIGCATKSRNQVRHGPQGEFDESDVSFSEDGAGSDSSKGRGVSSSAGSSLQEGEYCFEDSDADSNAMVD